MTAEKKLIPHLLWTSAEGSDAERLTEACCYYEDNGADEILLEIPSITRTRDEETFLTIRRITREIDVPLLVSAPVERLEDVKKYLYAGASAVVFDTLSAGSMEVYPEAKARFGAEKCFVQDLSQHRIGNEAAEPSRYAMLGAVEPDQVEACLRTHQDFAGDGFILAADYEAKEKLDLTAWKSACLKLGIPVNTFQSAVNWSDFKRNEAGLIPVIVQDYKTGEVLMMAYMNEEAFQKTCETGRMTYYSRSRRCLWLKGETSGHFQYVKSLTLDCDNDTILARVKQIGAACHTGSRSCFFRTLAKKEYTDTNPLQVLEHVYGVIEDRKVHPREGSYTNYLFDKGIDKILKKVGEEATEIVIAAKNPDPEEIKYEISDFLYHVMVLMVERGVTWTDITKELANRE